MRHYREHFKFCDKDDNGSNDFSFLTNKRYYSKPKYFTPENSFVRYKILNYINNMMIGVDSLDVITKDNIKFLTGYLDQNITDKLYKKLRDICGLHRLSNHNEDSENNEDIEDEYDQFYNEVSDAIKGTIRDQLSLIDLSDNEMIDRFRQVKKTFNLTEIELEVLIFHFNRCLTSSNDFEMFLKRSVFYNLYSQNGGKVHNYLPEEVTPIFLNVTGFEVKKAYDYNNSNLFQHNLVEPHGMYITTEIYDYLNGDLGRLSLIDSYCVEVNLDNTLDLADFSSYIKDIDILLEMIKSNVAGKGLKILLYGVPGCGKTEFAKTISKASGKNVYELKSTDKSRSDDEKEVSFKLKGLTVFENSMGEKNSVLIVDEADELLSTSSNMLESYNENLKGRINRYFDDSRTVQIWITNSVHGIDDSTKRRFDYCIAFEKFNLTQRTKIWANILIEYNLKTNLNDSDIRILAKKYELNAGNIRNAILSENC